MLCKLLLYVATFSSEFIQEGSVSQPATIIVFRLKNSFYPEIRNYTLLIRFTITIIKKSNTQISMSQIWVTKRITLLEDERKYFLLTMDTTNAPFKVYVNAFTYISQDSFSNRLEKQNVKIRI